MAAAPVNSNNAGGVGGGGGNNNISANKSVVRILIECYSVFCQIGIVVVGAGGGEREGERRDRVVQGMLMLASGGGVGTKEGLVLEKMRKRLGQ